MGVWGWVLLGMLGYVVGEIASKFWANAPREWFLPAVYLGYTASVTCWLVAMAKRNELAVLSTLWSSSAAVTSVLLGVVLFREQPTAVQWLGLAMAMLSIYLLS